jgi:hypothetical protein
MQFYFITAKAFSHVYLYLLVQMLSNPLFGYWNLDHWILFVIWYLVLGILIIFIKPINFGYSVSNL